MDRDFIGRNGGEDAVRCQQTASDWGRLGRCLLGMEGFCLEGGDSQQHDIATYHGYIEGCPWFYDVRSIVISEAESNNLKYEEVYYGGNLIFKALNYRVTGRKCDIDNFEKSMDDINKG